MTDRSHATALARRYSSGAEIYQAHWAPVLAPAGRRLVEGLDIGSARSILDLGTGVGTLLPVLAAAAPEAVVVGADRAEGMLRQGPEPFGKVVLDAATLSFREQVFDAVTMAFMLFHVLMPETALREVRRVLRRGGVLGVATWEASDGEFLPQQIWTQELDRLGADPIGVVQSSREKMNEADKLRVLIEGSGLRVGVVERYTLSHTVDPEAFIERRSQLGLEADRFRSLSQEGQQRHLETMGQRLGALTSRELTSNDVVLLAWAKRP